MGSAAIHWAHVLSDLPPVESRRLPKNIVSSKRLN
jgi:hypothetical protein